jgi:hypothetical protein
MHTIFRSYSRQEVFRQRLGTSFGKQSEFLTAKYTKYAKRIFFEIGSCISCGSRSKAFQLAACNLGRALGKLSACRTLILTWKKMPGGYSLWVANLSDIIASKRAAGRPRDKAVLEILEKTLRENNKTSAKA